MPRNISKKKMPRKNGFFFFFFLIYILLKLEVFSSFQMAGEKSLSRIINWAGDFDCPILLVYYLQFTNQIGDNNFTTFNALASLAFTFSKSFFNISSIVIGFFYVFFNLLRCFPIIDFPLSLSIQILYIFLIFMFAYAR